MGNKGIKMFTSVCAAVIMLFILSAFQTVLGQNITASEETETMQIADNKNAEQTN